MRRTIVIFCLLVTSGVLPILQYSVLADTPLPPPKITEVCSRNKDYCAVMDPRQMTTTVYRIEPGDRRTKVWAMYGWFRVADLSNDGEHLVAGHPGINLLPLDYKMDDVMIYFFLRGELIRTVELKELVPERTALKRTASHFLWGSYIGLDSQDRYTVKTVEDRVLTFDVHTGQALSKPVQ